MAAPKDMYQCQVSDCGTSKKTFRPLAGAGSVLEEGI